MKTISAFCIVALVITVRTTVQAATFFTGSLLAINATPQKDGDNLPTDKFTDTFNTLLNVDRSPPPLETLDNVGGAILGATGTVSSSVQFIGNNLGQFGIHTNSLVVVPVGAPQGRYDGFTNVNAQIQDNWYLNAVPRYTNLRVRAHWDVNGDLSSDVTGFDGPIGTTIGAYASSILRFYGSGVTANLHADSQKSVNVDGGDYTPPPTKILLDMVFKNGVGSPFNFEVNAQGESTVTYNDYALVHPEGGYANTSLSFGHTFTWGGIDDVSDADTGEEITDWTLTSDSGFDWTHAAPEPSSLVYAVVSAAILLPLLRKRRPKQG
jgi:hypothetical protein